MNQLKVFSAREANDLLPQITPLLQELRLTREAILNLEVEIDALELIHPKKGEAPAVSVGQKVEEYTQTVNRFYALIDTVHQIGCVIKDIDMGLVDFYALHKGKVVYLCWKLGEKEIGHWHEIGTGYTSRQPLEPPAGPS